MERLLLFLHLLLFQFPSFSSSFNFLCHHDESSALLQFKSSFTIDPYPRCGEPALKIGTWKNGTDCCSWNGVTCDTIYGHVIGLNLGCEGIEGILDSNSTLFHLAHLQKLNLSYNHFSNSHFHYKFGGFLSLIHLDLSGSFFGGEVPVQISHLSKLESLHLSENYLLVWKETILKRLVQNATNLRELFLDETNMTSITPDSIGLIFNQSTSLVTLNLKQTGLSGKLKNSLLCLPNIRELDMSNNVNVEDQQLPKLSCSTSLRILDLYSCQFKGLIPLSFSNFTHLTSIDLSENNLNGSIPSSLLTLPCLTTLYLDYNDLSGQIPNVFLPSNRFQELDVRQNNFAGLLPTSLSNLQQLTVLSLSQNSFSGNIPSSLFILTQLIRLDCSNNKLQGPLSNKITGFQKLTYLNLRFNLLNGTIPSSLLSLPSLVYLDLSNNQLTGHISAISSYSLVELHLNDNKLQGNIPESIFNLANLTDLDLSSNNLTGLIDFHHFSKLPNLISLSLSYNSQLSLKFESNVNYNFSKLEVLDLSSLSLTEFPKLSEAFSNLDYLDLSNNKLRGRVPNWLLETMDSLTFLNLSQNFFTSINQFSRNNEFLCSLDLSFNLLDGDLPVSICNMSELQFLNFAHNKLSGIIPKCLANLSYLQILDLQMNRFYGSSPTNFSKHCLLQSLNLNGNQLEGHLPNSLSRCKKLEYLNLGSNKIEDYFPVWFQTLQYLEVLVLRDNRLHGSIANLTIRHPFPSLTIFDISGNNFSGPLPKDYLKKFESMKNAIGGNADGSMSYMLIDVLPFSDGYYDSVTVIMKGNKIEMVKILTSFVSIDFSRNKFEGEIPYVIGELHSLKGLNLSHNRLTGHIPQSMGNLTNLESLDLSSNMLTGMIPAELTNLNSLEVLDLSNNHLVEEIPQGKQFDTFSNDSYDGNMGLCGLPLSKKCGPEQHHTPPSPNKFWSEEKFGFGWKPVAIGYGCGFVIGICIGYFVFLIGKPRWLVILFGGQPKRRVNKLTRVRRTNGSTQMVQMSY